MKTLRIFAPLVLIIFMFACTKEDTETGFNGKWELSETLADPGNGSGAWKKASNSYYVIFNADGTLGGTYYSQFKEYEVIDGMRIEFTHLNDTKSIYFYKLSVGTIEISGGCIEACGSRFER